MVEQPSILSSLRTPMATATIEPALPDRLGGLGIFSSVSPTEERSPDAVSSASEATEAGQLYTKLTRVGFCFSLFLLIYLSLPQHRVCSCSPEPPGSSLCHRELFCPSAQRIRQQQSVFFWSQRPPHFPSGSTKTRSNRQPASGHHRPHEGKDDSCLCV